MMKNKFILTAVMLLTLASSALAQVPVERSRVVNPSSTSTTWFRAGITPTDCSAPQYSFTGDTDTGIGYSAANSAKLCVNGTAVTTWTTTAVTMFTDLVIPAANTYFFSSRGGFASPSDGVVTLRNNANTDFSRLQFGGTSASFPSLKRSGTGVDIRLADDSASTWLSASELYATGARITNGAATGLTVNSFGQLQRQVYKVTIDRTAFVCAAVTCDVTLAAFPAKTALLGIYGDVTAAFACSGTCTSSTLSALVGKGSGGAQYLASFDVDAAVNVFGDQDAELGSSMTRAAAIQAGAMEWTAVATVQVRLTSGTGNIGTGAATNLSTGSITFYLVTERLP